MKPRLNIFLFLGISSAIITLGCEGCLETKAPDLLYDSARLATSVVNLDESLILESSILNERADCSNCVTNPAQASDRSIKAEYRANENEPWVDVQFVDLDGMVYFELVKPVPEIKAGEKYARREGFRFQNTGLYRYGLSADHSNLVTERNENNNDANSNDGSVKAIAPGRFFLEVMVVDPVSKTLPERNPDGPVLVTYLQTE